MTQFDRERTTGHDRMHNVAR